LKKNTVFIILFLFVFPAFVSAQWENKVFKEGIETVQCYKLGFPLNPPFMQLATPSDRIVFSFDDLNTEQSIYYYTLVHCSANWETSDLPTNSYLDGFVENELYNYAFSINTLQEYTHFELELPNRDVGILLSGNYILKVFEGLDQEQLVITQRIVVYETEATIKIKVKSSSVVADRDYKQEVDFNVNTAGLKVYNPYEEIKVLVMQNMRWDNAIEGLQPKFIKGNELVYDFEEKSSFDGGNEYRNIDIKDIGFQSERIARIITDSARVNIILHPDEKRTFKRYSTWEDINGNYLIKNDRAFKSEVEADYFYVYFTLPFDFPLNDAKLYLAGLFSNYTYSKKYEMHYDFEEQAYKGRLFLKQGYYNFAYFYVQNGEKAGQMPYIEGSHYQTNNDYTVIVYYRDTDRSYDRVVGLQYAVSHL
jgi:hypothetical protein